jgi:hypothetical protein
MRFPDFLRTTVLISAGAATLLGVVTLAGANGNGNDLVVPIAAGWWFLTALGGAWIGRRASTSAAIASLARARSRACLSRIREGPS